MSTIGKLTPAALTERFVVKRDELIERARAGKRPGEAGAMKEFHTADDEFHADQAVVDAVGKLRDASEALGLGPIPAEVAARGSKAAREVKLDETVRDQAVALDVLLGGLEHGKSSGDEDERAIFELARNRGVVGVTFNFDTLEVIVKDPSAKTAVRRWFDKTTAQRDSPLEGLRLVLSEAVG